ncbi:MAG: tetratricopeptide repeat protein [Elusimicrobia bacterium]|nr:tetratricopeptide repeat protein [Elusimicrobiota bacterium]
MARGRFALAAALLLLSASARGAGADAPAQAWDLLSEEQLSLHHKAVAHWGSGMYETAAREFDRLLEARPAPAMAVVNLGMMRLSQRKYEEALPHLERAAVLMPDSPRVLYLLGKCLLGLERGDDAVARLTRAGRLDPREPAIPLRLAEAHAQAGREDSAQAELRRVLELRPDHGAALVRLGRMLERLGRGREGAALLERFARLGKRRAREAERCAYESPLDPPVSGPAGGGGRWLAVRAVGLERGARAVVTVQAGRLILRRRAGAKPVRFGLGGKSEADVVRVDWADGTHTHRVGVPADREVLVEQVSAHIW